MALFTIYCTARADIEETWQIEAASEAEARELFEECPDGQVAVLISDRVDGNEENREIASIEEAEPLAVSDAAAPRVWIAQGEHFSVPGVPMSVHTTEAGANDEAASLVNIMLKDTGDVEGKPETATASDWQSAIEWLQEYHGAGDCWVEVSSHDVREA